MVKFGVCNNLQMDNILEGIYPFEILSCGIISFWNSSLVKWMDEMDDKLYCLEFLHSCGYYPWGTLFIWDLSCEFYPFGTHPSKVD